MSRDDSNQYDKFRGDVFYEVWRGGGNPDAINYDRLHDAYYDSGDAHNAASQILHQQNEARRQREPEPEPEPVEPEQEEPEPDQCPICGQSEDHVHTFDDEWRPPGEVVNSNRPKGQGR